MDKLCWDPAQLTGVFAVPAVVAERHLKLAGAVQLKVLLWFARNSAGFDAAACGKALGISEADCRDALQYWVESGVLHRVGEASPPVTAVAPAAPATAPPVPVRRPAPVKPQMTEVVQAQRESAEFAYLLETVAARLGRPLSPGDMETLLYLLRTAGLPAEVILMAVGYAAQSERFTVRYVEKIALDWADRGILTIDAAEKHLCYLEHCQQALLKVQTVCELPSPLSLTATNMSLAEKWVFQWHVPDELLREAYALCVEKTGKFGGKYMDRILENWQSQGITSTEDLTAAKGKRPARAAGDTASDYEQMVEQYVPVYKKKSKKG